MVYTINPPATWWVQPLCDAGMRFSMFAAAFTIIGLFTGRKNVPDVRPVFSLWELGVFCLIGVAALNLVIGIDHGPGTMYAFDKFWKVTLFVLTPARLAPQPRHLHPGVWTRVRCGRGRGTTAAMAATAAISKSAGEPLSAQGSLKATADPQA